MTTRFSALTRFNTAGCSARPTARTLRAPASARVRRRSRRPRVAARARPFRRARRALGPRGRLSRAFVSAPVSNARIRLFGGRRVEGTDRSRRDRGSGGSVARARVPPFSRRDAPLPRGAVLVVRAREARGGLEAGLRQSDAHERPRPAPPVHAEPAGHAKRFRGRRRALALVHVRGPLALRGPRLGARARLLAPAREPRVGDRARGGAPRPRGVPRRPGDGRRARAMRLARLPPPRRPPRRRHPGDAQGRARRRDRREIRRRRAARGGEPARA